MTVCVSAYLWYWLDFWVKDGFVLSLIRVFCRKDGYGGIKTVLE